MKFIVTLFWSLIIGQVVGYIMAALLGVSISIIQTAVVSGCFAIFVLIFDAIAIPKKEKN